MAHPFWPLFDLVVRTPALELRPPTDEMCVELARAASPSIFPDGENHFKVDWLSEPSPQRERHSMQWWWRQRAAFSPELWRIDFAVLVDGRPVGAQSIAAERFALLRSVSTGSWLTAELQGRGLGTEMRSAVLHFAFDGLGALEALSGAFEGNARSIKVSRRLGYEDNGVSLGVRADGRAVLRRNFRMTAERFAAIRRPDVVVANLEPCLELFGVGKHPAPPPAGPGG